MISSEQKQLAGYVKEVHLSLRRRTKEIGAEKAWQEHLQNEEVLKQYAESMKKLSEDYWQINNESKTESLLCRNEWMTKCVLEYFDQGGFVREIEKEAKKMRFFLNKGLLKQELENVCSTNEYGNLPTPPYKVLDVGSCHNPLKKFEFLDVYPIDLCPAIEEVKTCNFLTVTVLDNRNITGNWFESNPLIEFPSGYFDIVVFSLFLEYLPAPKQRYKACSNAYKCLKPNGLLLIVTPDSKHATANSGIMTNWKIAAATLGFNRIRLDKLKYLYCMAFRRSISPEYPLLLYDIEVSSSEEMFIIPQDSVDYKTEDEYSSYKTEYDENEIKSSFNELPFS
ncbi:hypothetical protein RUM44_010104 [Polyplax serrata]|uniref:S-adenosylmethionine sensor upstream of mTORC1 n=1 Tax=Polyplax serrata TaxID=468196 RepID=A0ABR1AUN0_POLSC